VDDDSEARRAKLAQQALSANVGGRNGIQHAAWWKLLLTVAILVAVPLTIYRCTAPRRYEGPVAIVPVGDQLQVRLGTTGSVVDLDPQYAEITVNGGQANLPSPLPSHLSSSPADLVWIPYPTERNGANGWVVTLDFKS
jgi:hypothetical protein